MLVKRKIDDAFESEAKRVREQIECKICNTSDFLLAACGCCKGVICSSCKRKLIRCPYCRGALKEALDITASDFINWFMYASSVHVIEELKADWAITERLMRDAFMLEAKSKMEAYYRRVLELQVAPVAFVEELYYSMKASTPIRKCTAKILLHTPKVRITHSGGPPDVASFNSSNELVGIVSSLFPVEYEKAIPQNAHYVGLWVTGTVDTMCGSRLKLDQYYVSRCLEEGYSVQTLAAFMGDEVLAGILVELASDPPGGDYAGIPRTNTKKACLGHGYLSIDEHQQIFDFISKRPHKACNVAELTAKFGAEWVGVWLSEACESDVMGRYARLSAGEVQLTGAPRAAVYGDHDIVFDLTPK